MATLVTPISVGLISPGGYTDGTSTDTTPLLLTQTVSYGAPINPVSGGAIGGFMLGGEQISLSSDSVLISAYQGDSQVARTGYLGLGTEHARYELSGLAIAGRTITGIAVYAFDGFGTTGFTGVLSGAGVSIIDGASPGTQLDTLIFNLDDLRFVDRPGGSSLNHADFRIDIISQDNGSPPPPPPPPPNGVPVPEPGSLALALFALVAARTAADQRKKSVTTPAPRPIDGD